MQPVSVADTARIAVGAALGRTVDAAGPEAISFASLAAQVRHAGMLGRGYVSKLRRNLR